MEFKQWLEMAFPLERHLNKVYYHGTSFEDKGLSILKDGIQPPDLTLRKKNMFTPVKGKIYITPSLSYGIIYCLGGDMAGHDYPEARWGGSRYGYLFEINGQSLKDIQPDEDSVGELLETVPWLLELARRYVAKSRIKQALDGISHYQAAVGKQIMKYLTDYQKWQLIDLGAHIAHTGALIPSRAWKFDKSKSKELHTDGSNFFELAEAVI